MPKRQQHQGQKQPHRAEEGGQPVKQAHIVPAGYLRRFTNAQGRLHVCRTADDQVFQLAPEKASREGYFYAWATANGYDQQVEAFLSKRYEAFLPDALDVAHGMVAHSPHHLPMVHKVLARFTALQLVRTRRIRKQLQRSGQQEAQVPGVTLNADQLALGAHLNMLTGQSLSSIGTHLSRLVPRFLIAPDGHPFYTSDHPVVTALASGQPGKVYVTASTGIGRDGLELFYPLSPHLSYVLTPQGTPGILRITPQDVDVLNTLTWVNAELHVYASVPPNKPQGTMKLEAASDLA